MKLTLKPNGGIDGLYRGHGFSLKRDQVVEIPEDIAAKMIKAHPDWFEIVKEKAFAGPDKNKAVGKPNRNK